MKESVNTHISDELLVRFLMDETDADQQALVIRWLQASEANRQYYGTFVLAATHARPVVSTSQIDEEAEWLAFRNNLRNSAIPIHLHSGRPSRPMLRIAAIFILLAGLAASYFWGPLAPGHKIISGSQVLTALLPDGSGVTLNKRSTLRYGRSYDRKDRVLQLAGEAFFTVAPNSKLPFIIHVRDVQIRALGTSFNVRTEMDKTEIIVETGEVQVKQDDQIICLHGNEKVTLYKAGDKPVTRSLTDSLYIYYRTRKFICNGTPVRELVSAVNTAYDQHICFADERDGDLPITVTFTDRSLTDILAVIGSTLQLKSIPQGDKIILKNMKKADAHDPK